MNNSYKLLMGSVGDDSHSIGMFLLKSAFQENGFFVRHLGVLNTIEDFLHNASHYDAVFISCINGHVDLYLEEFPKKLGDFKTSIQKPVLWYLGGNLSVQETEDQVIKKYLHYGFDLVAPKPVSYNVIYKNLMKDFNRKHIQPRTGILSERVNYPELDHLDLITDEPMSDQEFKKYRLEVLESWPTGKAVWNMDVKRNHINPAKNLHNLIFNNMNNGHKPLVQPRTGVALVEDEIDILQFLRLNGLDVSSIQLDAASRKKMYKDAQRGVERSTSGKTSFLNGYPVPVHGIPGMEKILSSIDTPFQIRAGSPDHRLVYEIGLAGGTTSLEGGFICYLFPYDKNTSPLESLNYWKYVDKLTGLYYQKYGIFINREYFGPLTTSLLEPSIPISINIVQAILSAKSGVKCISVGLAEQGNRNQDIAALRVLKNSTRAFLRKYGLNDILISTVFHQYMAAFPTDRQKARDLIKNSSITAALAGADRIMTKTPVESIHIPTRHDNAEGLNLTHEGIRQAGQIRLNEAAIKTEMQLIGKEVRAIMGMIEKLGNGSIARGAILAFKNGILDISFSPSIYNRNSLLTARDADGAMRFVNPALLPFDNEIIDFHNQKITERKIKERKTKNFELMESDLTRIWKNDYKRWPLDDNYLE